METLRISTSSWQHYFLAGLQLSRLEQTFFLPSNTSFFFTRQFPSQTIPNLFSILSDIAIAKDSIRLSSYFLSSDTPR